MSLDARVPALDLEAVIIHLNAIGGEEIHEETDRVKGHLRLAARMGEAEVMARGVPSGISGRIIHLVNTDE